MPVDFWGMSAFITSLATLATSLKAYFKTKEVHEDVHKVVNGVEAKEQQLGQIAGRRKDDPPRRI